MIQPLDNHVVIKAEELKELKIGGIIYTNPQPKTRKGEIISMGNLVYGLEVGDVVEFNPVNSVQIDGLFMVSAEDKENKILFKWDK